MSGIPVEDDNAGRRLKRVTATPADFEHEYAFDDTGRPRGGLWLLLPDVAKSFDVSTSTVQAWRRRPDWKPRFEGNIGGRVHVNVVQVFYWLCDRATAAGKPVESVHFELPENYETAGVFL
jgi:hypothetical protein